MADEVSVTVGVVFDTVTTVAGDAARPLGDPRAVAVDSQGRLYILERNGNALKVVERDGLCCSYVSPDGHRCGARAFLELDHERAWAKGGADSVENLRVLCRAHNQFLAEQGFGARVPARAG